MSFLEVYNENIRPPLDGEEFLDLREDPMKVCVSAGGAQCVTQAA